MRIHGENGDSINGGGSSNVSGDESQSASLIPPVRNSAPTSSSQTDRLVTTTSSSGGGLIVPHASQFSQSLPGTLTLTAQPSGGSKSFNQHSHQPTLSFRNPRDRVVLRYHCIHPNCKRSFKDESELRSHLIAYNPGMAAENQFLRDSVLTLLDFLEKAGKQIPSIQQAVSCCVWCFPLLILFVSLSPGRFSRCKHPQNSIQSREVSRHFHR